MHNLQKIAEICISEMKDVFIPICDDKIVKIKSEYIDDSYGVCEYDRDYNFTIIIDKKLLQDGCPLKDLKEVLIHELLHTSPRCLSHSKTWMKYANILNQTYGYSLLEAKDYDSIFHKEKPILYRYQCPKCGSTYNSRGTEECDRFCIFCKSDMIRI